MPTSVADGGCAFLVATAPNPGPIAVIQLIGAVEAALAELTGTSAWPIGVSRLADLGGVDDGVVARLSPDAAQLMPHGGPRVVERLLEILVARGVAPIDTMSAAPRDLYPEAVDDVEAIMLAALARATSPLAVDLLLDQPRRWRDAAAPDAEDVAPGAEDVARSARLQRLLVPPLVVVAGRANVGKSTLSNTLFGRPVSIALDRPGTTRDYTSGALDLGGLVVLWHDTPGLRDTEDDVESRAVALAEPLMRRADLLIALTDHEHDWPTLPREADLRVASKCDVAERSDADLCVSAIEGTGVDVLVETVREALVPSGDVEHSGVWLFDSRLGGPLANGLSSLPTARPH